MAGDIVEKTGAWYSYDDMKIGQGRENSKTFLSEDDNVLEEITNKVRSFMGLNMELSLIHI